MDVGEAGGGERRGIRHGRGLVQGRGRKEQVVKVKASSFRQRSVAGLVGPRGECVMLVRTVMMMVTMVTIWRRSGDGGGGRAGTIESSRRKRSVCSTVVGNRGRDGRAQRFVLVPRRRTAGLARGGRTLSPGLHC